MSSESTISNVWFYLALFLSQAMVAVNIVGSKYLLAFMSPWFILFVRFVVATVFLYAIHFGRKWLRPSAGVGRVQPRQLTKVDWGYIIAQALCAGMLFNLLMYWGLHYTSANVAGIITSTLPALIVIFSLFFLKEKLTLPTLLCILFAVGGLLVVNARNFAQMNANHLWGDLIVLLSMLPEAMYYVLSKLHHNRLPLFLVAAIMNLINLVVITIGLLAMGFPLPLHISTLDFLLLLLLGVASGLFFVFWYFGVRGVSGTTAGLFTAAMPISTMLLAWGFLQEQITLLQMLGMCLVLASIGFNVMRIKKVESKVDSPLG